MVGRQDSGYEIAGDIVESGEDSGNNDRIGAFNNKIGTGSQIVTKLVGFLRNLLATNFRSNLLKLNR